MQIFVKEAAPSLGKTYGAVNYIKENKNKKFIVASPSILLIKQTYSLMKQLGIEDVMMITSEEKYIGGVCRRFEECISKDEARVVLVTHLCLEDSYKRDVDFTGWELIIDEVPNNFVGCSSFEQLTEDEISTILHYVVCTDSKESDHYCKEIYRLKNGMNKQLSERIKHLKNGENILKDAVLHMYEYLLLGGAIQRWQDKSQLQKVEYHFVKVINPVTFFSRFKKVTLIAANIRGTLVGEVWSRIFKLDFIDSSDIKLSKDKLPNTDRIDIHYLLPDGRNMSKTLVENTIDDVEVFDILKDKAESLFQGEYIYAVNTDRKQAKISGQRVDVVSHGLNCYSHIHNALILYSCNPRPKTVAILQDLAKFFNLEDNTFVDAYIVSSYLETSFQIATRTSIRNHKDTHPITIVVPDERCATYLVNTWFVDAKIHHNSTVDIKVEDKRKNNSRPRSFQSEFSMNEAEKSAYRRWKKSQGINFNMANSEHYKYVKDWLLEYRSSR